MRQIILRIDPGLEIDDERRDERTFALRDELRDATGVETVDLVRAGKAPIGAKGDPVLLGTLLVTLASSGTLTALINAVQSWLTRQDRHSITVEIGGDKLTIQGTSSAQQQQLINAFLDRHTPA